MHVDRHLLSEAEAVCVEAVHQAGAVLRTYFRAPLQVEFKDKGQQDPVTEADRQSEHVLRASLGRTFPDHGIIGEEGEDVVNADADYVWFLDPLDGTTNFAAGLPAFAISMGLCFQGVPVLGVIAMPWEGPNGTIFRAHQGSGAWCNDVAIQVAAAKLPTGTQLASMPFWTLWQYRVQRRAPMHQANVRASGSIAYELAYAARGTFQYAIISGARLWDMVAGAVIVQEAGGTTLFSNGTRRRWSGWDTFLAHVLAAPFGHDPVALRRLHINMLAGNPELVRRCADQIILRRSGVWTKLRRRLRRGWKRLTTPSQRTPDATPTSPADS